MRKKFVAEPWSRDSHMIDDGSDLPGQRVISPAAARALAEAEARRKDQIDREVAPSKEQGRNGPDPTRYGDWEKGGIASDF